MSHSSKRENVPRRASTASRGTKKEKDEGKMVDTHTHTYKEAVPGRSTQADVVSSQPHERHAQCSRAYCSSTIHLFHAPLTICTASPRPTPPTSVVPSLPLRLTLHPVQR